MARLIWLLILVLGAGAAQAGTLSEIREAGEVRCGVTPQAPGFAISDGAGTWRGMDADFCRAVAAAVFGDAAKVAFTAVSAAKGAAALRSGQVDVLARESWTFRDEASTGVRVVGALFHDAYGFMVPRRLGVTSALELSGAEVCVHDKGTASLVVADYFHRRNMPHTVVRFDTADAAVQAYDAGRCDAYGGTMRTLAAHSTALSDADAHIQLSDEIAVEPRGPAVRAGDDDWAAIVRWTLFALINAEALGLTSVTVTDAGADSSMLVQRFVDLQEGSVDRFGLSAGWARNVVTAVGNYGEIYARNLGTASETGLERGVNRLWRDGGLMTAPPLR